MNKYRVHFGVRLTLDVDIEANSEKEAIEKARKEFESVSYYDMDYADDDVDVWQEK